MHLALKGRLMPNPSFGGKNENVKKDVGNNEV